MSYSFWILLTHSIHSPIHSCQMSRISHTISTSIYAAFPVLFFFFFVFIFKCLVMVISNVLDLHETNSINCMYIWINHTKMHDGNMAFKFTVSANMENVQRQTVSWNDISALHFAHKVKMNTHSKAINLLLLQFSFFTQTDNQRTLHIFPSSFSFTFGISGLPTSSPSSC